MPKTIVLDPSKLPRVEFSPELAARCVIEMRTLNRAGEYGFRVRLLSDETGDVRLIQAATQYADDFALAVGVRGERLGTGETPCYASSAGGYTQTQLNAVRRLREAVCGVGADAMSWLYLAVIECLSALEIARRKQCSDVTAAKYVRVSLEALADWYDGVAP